MNKLKQLILCLQTEKDIFCNGDSIVNEKGKSIVFEEEKLFWNEMKALQLGKCGELYAQYVLEGMGCVIYESIVDDHGVDFLAKYNDFFYRVQVKTIRKKNYTFIRKNNLPIDFSFYVFYIRVSDNGIPVAYFFPMNYIIRQIPEEGENKCKFKCFTDREYISKESKPEYGISGANKYFCTEGDDSVDFYCIARGWELMADRFSLIMNKN